MPSLALASIITDLFRFHDLKAQKALLFLTSITIHNDG
jgi:hypothetical protein